MIQNVELQTPQPRRRSWLPFSGLMDAGLVLPDPKDPKWVNPLRREGRCVLQSYPKGPAVPRRKRFLQAGVNSSARSHSNEGNS